MTRKVLDRAAELGINFIDTAAAYGDGESESYFGAALRGRRDQFVVATKTYLDNRSGTLATHLHDRVDESLTKLGTDHVDLYQIHRADPSADADDLMEALDDLVRAGKVLEVGCSNYAAWRLVESNLRADRLGVKGFVSIQREYNLLRRGAESELLSACETHGVSLIPYFPLASGLLWRGEVRGDERFRGGATASAAQRARASGVLTELAAFARDAGHSIGELAIAWLAAHGDVASIVVGVRSDDQLEEVARSTAWVLTEDEMAAVNDITSTGEEVRADDPFGRRPAAATSRT